jgi:chromosome segregation protein
MFADAATGAHSPALVSQGKIAAVIAAKPAERRQMLEEAAGIAGLHVRRKDAEQKLRAAETNLTRLDELLADMEVRASALRRQARAAERYRQLSEQIRVAEARLIFARWRDAAAAAEAAKKEALAAEAAVNEAGEAQRGAAAWQNEAAKALGDARSTAQTSREQATALSHRLASLRSERVALEKRLTELAQQRGTLARDRSREDTLAVDAAEALARLAEEDKRLSAELSSAETRRTVLEADVVTAERTARRPGRRAGRCPRRACRARLRPSATGARPSRGRPPRARSRGARRRCCLRRRSCRRPAGAYYRRSRDRRRCRRARRSRSLPRCRRRRARPRRKRRLRRPRCAHGPRSGGARPFEGARSRGQEQGACPGPCRARL